MKQTTTSDLRLGNWLYDSQPKGFPMQVEGIGRDWIYLNFEGNEGDCFENTDKEIYPIPIADKLLKCLKFKSTKNPTQLGYYLTYFRKDDNFWRGFSLDFRFDSFWHGYSMRNEIKYVHELQNLYHALTGKELEIKREWL